MFPLGGGLWSVALVSCSSYLSDELAIEHLRNEGLGLGYRGQPPRA